MDPTTLRMFSGAAGAAAPVIISFTASNYYPAWNAISTLTWNITNSASQSINQGIGNIAVSGSIDQQLNETTRTYTLTALDLDGVVYSSSITITGAARPWWA